MENRKPRPGWSPWPGTPRSSPPPARARARPVARQIAQRDAYRHRRSRPSRPAQDSHADARQQAHPCRRGDQADQPDARAATGPRRSSAAGQPGGERGQALPADGARPCRGGWPDSAATTGTRATVRAGWRAASIAVMTASAIPVMITNQGSASGSITWPAAACRRGTYASQRRNRRPIRRPRPPRRRRRRGDHDDGTCGWWRRRAEMPRARSRRCAMTVNPATATRPMNTRPSTDAASAITAG